MWPLLQRDGIPVQYLGLTLLWNFAIGYNPFTLRASFVKYLSLVRDSRLPLLNVIHSSGLLQASYLVVFLLHTLETLASPPAHLPDLFPVLNLTLSAGVFGLAWLWATKRLTQEAWALGGIGFGEGTFSSGRRLAAA